MPSANATRRAASTRRHFPLPEAASNGATAPDRWYGPQPPSRLLRSHGAAGAGTKAAARMWLQLAHLCRSRLVARPIPRRRRHNRRNRLRWSACRRRLRWRWRRRRRRQRRSTRRPRRHAHRLQVQSMLVPPQCQINVGLRAVGSRRYRGLACQGPTSSRKQPCSRKLQCKCQARPLLRRKVLRRLHR
jgi:hypothetical protein